MEPEKSVSSARAVTLLGWIVSILLLVVIVFPEIIGKSCPRDETLRVMRSGLPVFVLVQFVCTIALARHRRFPKRSEGLSSSWIGSIVLICWYWAWYGFHITDMQINSAQECAVHISEFMLTGIAFSTGLTYWFCRGRGMIITMAAAMAVLPSKYSEKIESAIDRIPFTEWKLIPVYWAAMWLGCLLLIDAFILSL